MTKDLEYFGTLSYYDGIQIFECRDEVGGNYIGVLVDEFEDGYPIYVVVGVKPIRLQEFRLGKVDLLTIMRDRPRGEWFRGPLIPKGEDSLPHIPARLKIGEIPETYLP